MKKPVKFISLSASAITSFLTCPQQFQLSYIEGIRKLEDDDKLRMGTNWHALHEVYQTAFREYLEHILSNPENEGIDSVYIYENAHSRALDAAAQHLREAYSNRPGTKSPDEWGVEQEILLASFLVYLWHYQGDRLVSLADELEFKLPLHHPETGLPLPIKEVARVGKIDHIVVYQGRIMNMEMKSTSQGIEPSSEYWQLVSNDHQVSMYALSMRDMVEKGLLPPDIVEHEAYDPNTIGATLYDVWRKPQIKPKMLTQGETKAFIETGQYHGQEFEVTVTEDGRILIDGDQAQVKEGKSGDAIRETLGMYRARLMATMMEDPERYFQRKEIARTSKQIQRFRVQLYNIYRAMRNMEQGGGWYPNYGMCDRAVGGKYACPYKSICHGPKEPREIIESGEVPDGFSRRGVSLTVERKDLNG